MVAGVELAFVFRPCSLELLITSQRCFQHEYFQSILMSSPNITVLLHRT